MKRLVLIVLGCALLAASVEPAASSATTLLVVGRDDAVLHGPGQVELRKRTARVGKRRCSVAARTPLSVLLGARLDLRLRDYGACGRDVRDSSGLYVAGIEGLRERGRGGWVYKLGHRAPGTGAADPVSRVRASTRVRGFGGVQDSGGGCQRTLEATPDRTSALPGETLQVTVRGYDDNGRGVPVAGATVRLGGAGAISDERGVATVTVPAGGGRVVARKAGLVRSFPVRVTAR